MTIYFRTPFLDRRRRLDDLVQIAIAILSPAAILLLGIGGAEMRWGFVIGLCSQPFWLYASLKARQFGMSAISLFYFAFWIVGILRHFPELLS